MNKYIAILLLLLIPVGIYAQKKEYRAPLLGVKSNLLSDAVGAVNLGVEMRASKKISFDLSGEYIHWATYGGRIINHSLVQPEMRYWLSHAMKGHFFGAHIHFGQFNLWNWGLAGLNKDYRYEGDFVGAGISYGYQFRFSSRWHMEITAGYGFAYLNYDKYYRPNSSACSELIKNDSKRLKLLPTKAALSLIYIIK